MFRRFPAALVVCLLLLSSLASAQLGGDPNECDFPGEEPDVIVGDLPDVARLGRVGNMTAFAVATTSCNVGSCWLEWFQFNERHPVIGQNVYRLKDGRFEMIGMGWLKHGFFALSQELCSSDCESTSGEYLGINCSDPYDANLNGNQNRLGPRYEVNAFTGDFNYPFTGINQTGDNIFKRIQLHDDDLDPSLNAGAQYFVEGQYVTPDDAAAGNGNNNVSYRTVDVLGSGGFFAIDVTGSTVRTRPAIFAWKASDLSVQLTPNLVPGEGVFYVASQAYDNGNGTWDYEYAVYNQNSYRGIGRFRVPLPAGAAITNIDFHDVDYHSGELQDGTDWPATQPATGPNYIEWKTDDYAPGTFPNVINWGTVYNFRFTADVPPVTQSAEVGFWRPDAVNEMAVTAKVPQLCDNDGVCELGEDCDSCPNDCFIGGTCCGDDVCGGAEDSCNCVQDCGPAPLVEAVCNDAIDEDCDGAVDCADTDCCGVGGCGTGPDGDSDNFDACSDCDDGDSGAWRAPGEVEGLTLDGGASTLLNWAPPSDPGAISVGYGVLRADAADGFSNGVCIDDTAATQTSDVAEPSVGSLFYYLIYASNACPDGDGSLGQSSAGVERVGATCP